MRDFGAKGDGTVNDRDAIQHAEFAAQPGDTIYFPAGTYVDDDGTDVSTSNLTFLGDGPSSVIKHNYRPALKLGTAGETLTGLVVRRLKFVGLPGLDIGMAIRQRQSSSMVRRAPSLMTATSWATGTASTMAAARLTGQGSRIAA